MIASDDGLDTALARVLHEQGSVDLGSLQQVLEEVRSQRSLDPGLSLAVALRSRDLVSHDALQQAFQSIDERAAPSHDAALRNLGLPADIGPYRVARELSRGGMGAIHEIIHERSGVSFALKTILPNIGEGAGEEFERFRREGVALGRLNHPHVVCVHGANLEGPTPYLIQDLLPGGTLQARIDREPYLVPDALELTRQLGEGLAHAHERGVLHRDLKPLNVLFDDRDQPRLVDFGLARFASGSSLTQTGQLLGTPSYMAPEQAIGGAVDERTDVYGLAGILFALLTGRPPFMGSGLGVLAAVVQDAPPSASSLNPLAPRWLDRVLGQALAKDPSERYPDVRSFLAALAAEQAPPPKRSWRVPLLAGAALVAVTLAGGLFQFAQQGRTLSQARDELENRLAPRTGAPRLTDLERELPRFRRAIGKEAGPVLLASGLVSVANDDEERAREVLATLAELPGEKRRADLLEACCSARWSLSKPDLFSAESKLAGQLRITTEVGFLDYHLFLGRARILSGKPVAGLESLVQAPDLARAEPWRTLLRDGAAQAAARGELTPDMTRELSALLPDCAAEFARLGDWADLVKKPSLAALVKTLETSGEIPPAYRKSLRLYAERRLKTARLPDAPPEASPTADGVHWGESILRLKIRTEIPLGTHVYRTLGDWTLVAHQLGLSNTEELYAVVREALHALGPRLTSEHSLQRQRLFETYLRASPTPVEVGRYALAASGLYGVQTRRARRTLLELTKDLPQPQQGFWRLWLDHLDALRPPPYTWPHVAREGYAEGRRAALRANEAWVQAASKNVDTLKTLRADPAVREVISVYDNLWAIHLFSLARTSVEAGEPHVALHYYDLFKPVADTYANEGWYGDYLIALSLALHHRKTPKEEIPQIQESLGAELLLALQGAHTDHLSAILAVAWSERRLLDPDVQQTVLNEGARLIDRNPGLVRVRTRAAWFALALGRAEEAQALLADASSALNSSLTFVGDRELASKMFTASAGELDLKLIEFFDWCLDARPSNPRLPLKRGLPEPGASPPTDK